MTNAPTNNGMTGLDHFDDCGGFTLGRACEFPEEFPAEDAEFAEEGRTNLEPHPDFTANGPRFYFQHSPGSKTGN